MSRLFAILVVLLASLPLSARAQPAPVSFLMPAGQVIVTGPELLKVLADKVQVSNRSGEAMPYRLAVARVSGGRVQGIKMSDPTQGPPGASPLPQGFLLEVSGVILPDGTEMVVSTRNVGGALSADPRQAAGQLLGAGAQALGGKDGVVLAILAGRPGEPLSGNIIMIGE